MASIIPGYEYDIFISYRQKDNKGDGWVTRFVDDLKAELEATFKEDISIYFDINPHDGLLEIHNVDKSLEGKLKTPIFIPIISQTYCDPNSFAWQHEFCVYHKMAREDPFGLDVKLRGGNVASRILPVKINDLDPEDNEMLEKELGGFLRSINFIYKEPGVNRPLAPDDDPKTNLNHTSYRNQINKVANAVKEIIRVMQNPKKAVGFDVDTITRLDKNSRKEKIIKQSVFAALILALIFAVFFIILALLKKEPDVREAMDKSIAVLPFQNLSAESEHAYFAAGLHDELLTQLSKVTALSLRGRTSVMTYAGTTKSIRQIADELNVGVLVEGSVQVVGGRLRVNVQLINALTDEHIWAESYDRVLDDAFAIQRDVAQHIVAAMDAALGSSVRKALAEVPTNNPEAYRLYLQGREYFRRPGLQHQNVEVAIRLYERAIALDPEFALAYAALSDAHGRMHWWRVDPSPERVASKRKQRKRRFAWRRISRNRTWPWDSCTSWHIATSGGRLTLSHCTGRAAQ
jgi:TolB-like protein